MSKKKEFVEKGLLYIVIIGLVVVTISFWFMIDDDSTDCDIYFIFDNLSL